MTHGHSTKSGSTAYEVGYKKPPREHQFQKGGSGNPQGRPKGSKSLLARMRATYEQEITVVTPGGKRTITKIEAAMTQLLNKAAGGDVGAIDKAVKIALQLGLRQKIA